MPTTGVFESVLTTPEARAGWDDASILQCMLDVEAAWAASQAECGLIPASSAQAIIACCKLELLDRTAILRASSAAGSLAIPLIRALRARVAGIDAQAARDLHFGATSQDLIDTTLVLLIQRALTPLEAELEGCVATLTDLARRHRHTPVLGRTLMQAAQVTSLGAKFAHWLAPLARARRALGPLKNEALRVQCGGAIGVCSLFPEQAQQLNQVLARRLGLSSSVTAWHTQRDRLARLAAELAILAGSLGKIGRDLALMMQSEIGELSLAGEDPVGGSSAMPHKRNPVPAMLALAASHRAPLQLAILLSAMPQEHERGLGNWQLEAPAWSELVVGVRTSVQGIRQALEALQIDPKRMLAHIEAQHGVVFSERVSQRLAVHLGKDAAEAILRRACEHALSQGRSLDQVLRQALASDARALQILEDPELFSAKHAAEAAGWVVEAILEELAM